jgi:regulator of protease activity HflC (stomatin/prohibitin superfamily)
MVIGIIVGIILFAAVCGLGFVAYKCYENDKLVGQIVCIVLAAVCAISFIIVPFSFHTVNSGEIAVVKHLGKITGTRYAGTNFDLWVTNSYQKYDTKVQTVEINTAAYSSDAQPMDIAMTLQYQIIPDKVVEIATHYGTLNVLESRLSSVVVEKSKSVFSSHKAMNIIASRAAISPEVEEASKNVVTEDYYVHIVAIVITNIDFSDSFEKAVEDKMAAEQAKLKADYENEKEIAKAEAEAKAIKIKAEAQAEANRILTQSLTDKVLESKFYDTWDGKLPQVMGEGSAILDVRGKTE